jgi:hypothetical protein
MVRMNTFYSLMLCPAAGCAVFAVGAELTFGPGPEGAGSTLDVIVAVVNDDVITRRELDAATAFGSKRSCDSARCRFRLAQCWNNRCWNG